MKHYLKLQTTPFKKILSGEKTIKLRLFDEKRSRSSVGDVIVFSEIHAFGKSVEKTITKIIRNTDFNSLVENIDQEKTGILKK